MNYTRPIEFWKPITNEICANVMENWYWISSEGRVYSAVSNKIMKLTDDKDGYKIVGLYDKNKNQRLQKVHRLVLKAFNYIPDHENFIVNHISAVKDENHEFNLEWATSKENSRHARIMGLFPDISCQNNPMSVISNSQADYIAQLLATENLSILEIEQIAGISRNIIDSIKKGRSWIGYYDKYDLRNKKIPRYNEVFTNDQIHFICKYFIENNIDSLSKLTKQVRLDILERLGLEPNYTRLKTIYRIYTKQRFTEISSNYNF